MADTTTSINDNLLGRYNVKQALRMLYANTVLYEFAKKTPLPQGTGKTVYWHSFMEVSGSSAAVAEGTSPTAVVMSSRTITATIAQYTRVLSVTDVASYASVLDMDSGANEAIRRSSTTTMEYLLHTGIFKAAYYGSQSTTGIMSALMSSAASALCSNTGTNSNSNKLFQFPAVFGTSCTRLSAVSKTAPNASAKASIFAIRKAVLALEGKNAVPYADGYFVGYAHPKFLYILRRDPSWLDWNKYTNSKETMYKGEVGQTERVRWIRSTLAPRYAVAAHSVNISFISGQEAFGATEAFGGVEIFKVSGADKSDPANQLTKYAFKLWGAAACLNPSAGVLLFTHELLS